MHQNTIFQYFVVPICISNIKSLNLSFSNIKSLQNNLNTQSCQKTVNLNNEVTQINANKQEIEYNIHESFYNNENSNIDNQQQEPIPPEYFIQSDEEQFNLQISQLQNENEQTNLSMIEQFENELQLQTQETHEEEEFDEQQYSYSCEIQFNEQ